jgi:phosphatidylethanolamine-binding protein (PEBP) family uncharacterized protein
MNAKTKSQNSSYKKALVFLLLLSSSLLLQAQESKSKSTDFKVSSPAFDDEGQYPKLYTCDGASISPPLTFAHIPKEAKMIAVTMSHIAIDGEQHVYWVFYNIPVNTLDIPQDAKDIGLLGHNTMNENLSYSPPCSKGPGEKIYTITAYAVSKVVTDKGLRMKDFLKKIKSNILATSTLSVKYSR